MPKNPWTFGSTLVVLELVPVTVVAIVAVRLCSLGWVGSPRSGIEEPPVAGSAFRRPIAGGSEGSGRWPAGAGSAWSAGR